MGSLLLVMLFFLFVFVVFVFKFKKVLVKVSVLWVVCFVLFCLVLFVGGGGFCFFYKVNYYKGGFLKSKEEGKDSEMSKVWVIGVFYMLEFVTILFFLVCFSELLLCVFSFFSFLFVFYKISCKK